MKKVFQTKFKKEGNCFPACLASVLEVSINAVPDYRDHNWFLDYRKWLRKYGLDLLIIQKESFMYIPMVYAIVSGLSPRGLQHATVYLGNRMIHDPHPEGGGVKDITDWIYIVSREPVIKLT